MKSVLSNGTGAWVARALTATFALCALGMSGVGEKKVEAFPAFATKEKKPCAFCHVKANGGGKRTPAGEYYKKNKTLKGFTGGAAPKPTPTPKPGKKP